jgi:hypothetical protein
LLPNGLLLLRITSFLRYDQTFLTELKQFGIQTMVERLANAPLAHFQPRGE